MEKVESSKGLFEHKETNSGKGTSLCLQSDIVLEWYPHLLFLIE